MMPLSLPNPCFSTVSAHPPPLRAAPPRAPVLPPRRALASVPPLRLRAVVSEQQPVAEMGADGRPLRVGIVCGGPSAERGVSLNSARSVLDHIQVRLIVLGVGTPTASYKFNRFCIWFDSTFGQQCFPCVFSQSGSSLLILTLTRHVPPSSLLTSVMEMHRERISSSTATTSTLL
jgi:hypothetical protein